MARNAALVVCAAAALVAAPVAAAEPPVSAISQYVEAIPTAQGDVPSAAAAPQQERPVAPAVARRIERLGGSDAKALTAIVSHPGYGPPATKPKAKPTTKQHSTPPQDREPPSRLTGIAVAAVDTTGGLSGAWIVAGLGLMTAAGIAARVARD